LYDSVVPEREAGSKSSRRRYGEHVRTIVRYLHRVIFTQPDEMNIEVQQINEDLAILSASPKNSVRRQTGERHKSVQLSLPGHNLPPSTLADPPAELFDRSSTTVA
jgi:hypothetical protein